jgi:hypothetical protein
MLLKIRLHICIWLFVYKKTKVQVEWSLEQSDHASLCVELHINGENAMEPGLTRINAAILEES